MTFFEKGPRALSRSVRKFLPVRYSGSGAGSKSCSWHWTSVGTDATTMPSGSCCSIPRAKFFCLVRGKKKKRKRFLERIGGSHGECERTTDGKIMMSHYIKLPISTEKYAGNEWAQICRHCDAGPWLMIEVHAHFGLATCPLNSGKMTCTASKTLHQLPITYEKISKSRFTIKRKDSLGGPKHTQAHNLGPQICVGKNK